ncbi:MCE family protein [Nocardioides marinquilinus]|uniref:MCE family protein n=1 Tax=Nocardioides marinquilinus TaxID=1210400 RepID=A0ABP9PCU3_9ACTN
MRLLDTKTLVALVKLGVFMVVTVVATGLLVVVIGNISFSDEREYTAVFEDVTGVIKGDDVRIAGVKVGSVKDIRIKDRTQAEVTFTVEEGNELTTATEAKIRYRNLVGQRYIALSQGVTEGDVTVLDEGDTIPADRTEEALDLTRLFNGFKPLFEALSPDDVNQLSFEVIQVFQGEGGTLEGLLRSTASLTDTLADRDAVIGDLLTNLDAVLDNIADRDQQLSALIVNFRQLVAGLKNDRQAILSSFDQITQLSVETADLVGDIRPPFVEDIKQLRRLTANLDRGKGELDRALQVLPIKLEKVGRTAIYGSWFNFYLCDFKGTVRLPGLTLPVKVPLDQGERCDLG